MYRQKGENTNQYMAKNDFKIGSVYSTNNLDQFRHLDENRELKMRAEKVKKSIEEYGWINQPILCNEKMEVIDGQARLQACKELGIGITYITIQGLGIKDCRVLNSINSNWQITDYIDSYAVRNVDYKYLQQLYIKFKSEFDMGMPQGVLKQVLNDASADRTIKRGKAKFTKKEYDDACKHLEYLNKFVPILKKAGVCTAAMMTALYFAARKYPEDKKNDLYKAFMTRCNSLLYPTAPGDAEVGIKMIDEIFNFKKTENRKFRLFRVYEDNGKKLYDSER